MYIEMDSGMFICTIHITLELIIMVTFIHWPWVSASTNLSSSDEISSTEDDDCSNCDQTEYAPEHLDNFLFSQFNHGERDYNAAKQKQAEPISISARNSSWENMKVEVTFIALPHISKMEWQVNCPSWSSDSAVGKATEEGKSSDDDLVDILCPATDENLTQFTKLKLASDQYVKLWDC